MVCRLSGAFRVLAVFLPLLGGLGMGTEHLAAAKTPSFAPHRLADVVEVLRQVPAGQKLFKRALQAWSMNRTEQFLERLDWADVSRTDTLLTRHFNAFTGKERQEREVRIYIRKNQPVFEAVLDLAHELVHALAPPHFDPYDPHLTAGKYILAAIEGEGGEVDAVSMECELGLQFEERGGMRNARCSPYFSLASQSSLRRVDREKIKRDFYRVGRWLSPLAEKLGPEVRLFSFLSDLHPSLYSSTGHAPYPYALYEEFKSITQLACENNRRRIQGAALSRSDESRFQETRCHTQQVSLQ